MTIELLDDLECAILNHMQNADEVSKKATPRTCIDLGVALHVETDSIKSRMSKLLRLGHIERWNAVSFILTKEHEAVAFVRPSAWGTW